MGLDMYLTRKTYVKNWEHTPEDKKHIITIKHGDKILNTSKVSYIIEEIGYWRKANHIHNWFMNNVGDDENGNEVYVSKEQLQTLLDTCNKVLSASRLVEGKIKNGETLDHEKNEFVPNMQDGKYIEDPTTAMKLLPTQSGFFFGSTEYDEYYYSDIQETIKILTDVLADPENDSDYYYSSSW